MLLRLALLVHSASALFFYLAGPEVKCFLEDLPKDTLVVGEYRGLEWIPETGEYKLNPSTGILFSVEEVFDNNHRVVNHRGKPTGQFTFTAARSGEHRLCFQTHSEGWFTSSHVKMEFDMAIGETSQLRSADQEKIDSLVGRVIDLQHRLVDIKREQVFQREREVEFRNLSESTNARVVKWSIIQLFVLGVTCAWQLTHLRGFFQKQKLV